MAKDLTEALHRLTQEANGQTTRQDKTLPASRDAVPIPDRNGVGPKKISPGSNGILSPLVETLYANRLWHPVTTIQSSDGIFTLKVKPIKTVYFTDAGGNAVAIEYKAPT